VGSGDWDSFSRLIEPVGALVLDRLGLGEGLDLLDVGTGSGGNVAIPAARRGANVVGLDVTLSSSSMRVDAPPRQVSTVVVTHPLAEPRLGGRAQNSRPAR
jgi:2-polyprenyl-3-methyl-5-hydroxy-6-metoxy-1,4-benzoquinol methylase